MKSKYIVPGLVAGALLIGTGSAHAFQGALNLAAFESFTADQKTAIEKAFNVRKAAHEEANRILEGAGISQEELREAEHAYREYKRQAVEEAIADEDYDAYQEAVADSPMAGEITEAQFQKLVQAHAFMESGDREGAREILNDAGLRKGFGVGFGGKGHGMMREASASAKAE